VRVEGQMTVNGIDESISAALAGFGIAYALEERIFGRTDLLHAMCNKSVRLI
jgi:hypothetical protein